MKKLFHMDSKFSQWMTLFFNLVVLNLLFLVCALPVITIGASLTAMYRVVFSYLQKQDDRVFVPFLEAFRDNFTKSTKIWVPHILVYMLMMGEAIYLWMGNHVWLWLVFGVEFLLLSAIGSYIYPILARYETGIKNALWNSLALALRHKVTSCCLVIVTVFPLVLIWFAPKFGIPMGLLWLMVGFSATSYLSGAMLLRVFQRYDSKEKTDAVF